MVIESIKLIHFRNYDNLSLQPHAGVNLFYGQNGAGKTNILEAVHYCALGKSHRVTHDQNVVENGEPFAVCAVTLRSGDAVKRITLRLTPEEEKKKTILIDRKKITRFSELMGSLRCVIFSPEDLDLIREGPALRRRFLDMMISQVSRTYFTALQQYRTGLEQRNALLKAARTGAAPDGALLEEFERIMASAAAVIVREREEAAAMLSGAVSATYARISGQEAEKLQIQYRNAFREGIRDSESMRRIWKSNREEDLRQGTTTVGPHRDDLNVDLNRKSMKLYASQGQVRTAALSLKLAQLQILKKVSGESPVLLLDDVMSELDRNRRTRLMAEIVDYQTFITGTDEDELEQSAANRVYDVYTEQGHGRIRMRPDALDPENPVLREPDFT